MTRRGWRSGDAPRTPQEMAKGLFRGEFDYQFTGMVRHLWGLGRNDVLVFRFMRTVVGEAQFDGWIDSDPPYPSDTMHCKNARSYSALPPSRGLIPATQNRYLKLTDSTLKLIRERGNQIGVGGFTRTDEKASVTTHRIGQGEIRRRALIRYEHRCAFCSVDSDELLVAGHIRGWARGASKRGRDDNVILFCTSR